MTRLCIHYFRGSKMAAGDAQVSALPLPPMQYVSLFSEENIRRGRAPKPPPPIKVWKDIFVCEKVISMNKQLQ